VQEDAKDNSIALTHHYLHRAHPECAHKKPSLIWCTNTDLSSLLFFLRLNEKIHKIMSNYP